MLDLFYQGNIIFMGILTLLLLIIIATAIYRAIPILNNAIEYATTFRHQLKQIKSLGVLALVLGILFQLMGLYQMFSAIEQMGDVSPVILAGGLKVSMISTVYGVIIFVLSYLIWMALDYKAGNASAQK